MPRHNRVFRTPGEDPGPGVTVAPSPAQCAIIGTSVPVDRCSKLDGEKVPNRNHREGTIQMVIHPVDQRRSAIGGLETGLKDERAFSVMPGDVTLGGRGDQPSPPPPAG